VQDFHDLRIVQLPVSICFRESANLERARRVFGGHPDFTLLVRDRPSLDFARRHFGCRVELVPDMAFAVGPFERPLPPTLDVVWLERTGVEAPERDPRVVDLPDGVIREDWSAARLPRALARRQLLPIQADLHLRKVQRRLRGMGRVVAPLRRRLIREIGPSRLQLAAMFLARGRAVITDRLHGHILCTLMNIPHVVLDNGIGKLSAYFDTWTNESPIGQFATNERDALHAALALAKSE
jgi:exopolysaccharide biosynthesis predicted pyruvyltransferase EpsI